MSRSISIACLIAAAAGALYAGDLKHETTIALGLNATDGNSETLTMNSSILTELEWEDKGSLDIGLENNYGKHTVDEVRKKNIDNGKIYANGRRLLTERTFAYLETSARYDDIALMDYRTTLGPGLGAHLIKREGLKLLIEAGASHIFQKVDGVEDNFTAFRIAEKYEHQFNASTKVWQSLIYLPRAEEIDRYLAQAELGFEVGLESTLSKQTTLRITIQNKYDSKPPAGVEKNDTTLITAIGIKL
jgi:putative salt-induced outer membrane protein YdiY